MEWGRGRGGGSSKKCCGTWALPCVNKSPYEYLEYRPDFGGDIPKKSQTSQNFNFITSCLQEIFPSLLIPDKIFRFLVQFLLFLPKQLFLELTSLWNALLRNQLILMDKYRTSAYYIVLAVAFCLLQVLNRVGLHLSNLFNGFETYFTLNQSSVHDCTHDCIWHVQCLNFTLFISKFARIFYSKWAVKFKLL